MIIITQPSTPFDEESSFKVGLMNPFSYQNDLQHEVRNIDTYFEKAGVMAVKIHKFGGFSYIYACGGFVELMQEYAAIWTIDPDTDSLTRVAYQTTTSSYFRELAFFEESEYEYIYTTLS